MPAPRVSQKLSGGRRGPPPRDMMSLEIPPSKLGEITLNRDAIQALTIAQAKVQITIAAGGTTAVLVSEETGRQIGGLDDLAKLLGLRAFVTKEKKLSASSKMQQELITVASRAHDYIVDEDRDFVQPKLDSSFMVAARPYKAMAELINSRYDPIRSNYGDGSQMAKTILENYCAAIGRAIELTIAELVKGEKEKGKFEAFLFETGVPAYVRNKLLMKSLAITKDMDLDRVLFPQDPSKGLALTVKEWRSQAFCDKQGPLLKHSGAIRKILQDDALVLELTGLTAEQWANEEDPRVQRVLKTRILAVPPFEDHERVLSLLAKQNFRGFGLPNTAMDQSKDRLANLCAVPIRAYAFSVRMAETRSDFYDRIFPAGTIQPVDDRRGNYARQALDAIKNGVECELIQTLDLTRASTALMQWIDRECKIIPGGTLSTQIARTLGLPTGGGDNGVVTPRTGLPKLACLVDMITIPSTGAERDRIKAFREQAFSLKEKNAVRKRTQAASVLSREAKTFLKTVQREHSPLLSEAMEAYFRGFYSVDIQSAAVRIAEARFDELDELSELGSSEDESSSDEGGAEV